jgi:hypothetical protein
MIHRDIANSQPQNGPLQVPIPGRIDASCWSIEVGARCRLLEPGFESTIAAGQARSKYIIAGNNEFVLSPSGRYLEGASTNDTGP